MGKIYNIFPIFLFNYFIIYIINKALKFFCTYYIFINFAQKFNNVVVWKNYHWIIY